MIGGNARESEYSVNFWPTFTDVSLIMIMILVLVLFIQIVSNTEAFKLQKIHQKQVQMKRLIEEAVGSDATRYIQFSTDFKIQYITFRDRVLFRQGRADLQERGVKLLGKIGKVLRDNSFLYEEIKIQGHTDKVPIVKDRSPFDSNWELSSARATAVVKYFDEVLGMDPYKIPISSVWFSKYRPIDPADTARAYEKNRRIEMALYYNAN